MPEDPWSDYLARLAAMQSAIDEAELERRDVAADLGQHLAIRTEELDVLSSRAKVTRDRAVSAAAAGESLAAANGVTWSAPPSEQLGHVETATSTADLAAQVDSCEVAAEQIDSMLIDLRAATIAVEREQSAWLESERRAGADAKRDAERRWAIRLVALSLVAWSTFLVLELLDIPGLPWPLGLVAVLGALWAGLIRHALRYALSIGSWSTAFEPDDLALPVPPEARFALIPGLVIIGSACGFLGALVTGAWLWNLLAVSICGGTWRLLRDEVDGAQRQIRERVDNIHQQTGASP